MKYPGNELEIFDEIKDHIKKGIEFKPKESILCNWCYYWEECPIKEMPNPYL